MFSTIRSIQKWTYGDQDFILVLGANEDEQGVLIFYLVSKAGLVSESKILLFEDCPDPIARVKENFLFFCTE